MIPILVKILPVLFLSANISATATPLDGSENNVLMNSRPKMIFVYNADSGFFNAISDYVHKITSPETYQCNLCALTYGNAGMKRKWVNYIKTLPVPVTFLHKDQVDTAEYKTMGTADLPAIFILNADKIDLFVSAREINEITQLDQLIALITNKLQELSS
ncbi:MAG: hypothetical protein V3U16_01335 [Candidatus Neomarinimicrobiota bacterium]